MAYKIDSVSLSLIWGRVGAVVAGFLSLILGLFGYQMDDNDVKNLVEVISTLLAGVAGILALVSKVRETKKVKSNVEDTQ